MVLAHLLLLFAISVQVVSGTEVCESTIHCDTNFTYDSSPAQGCEIVGSDVYDQCEDTNYNEVCHRLAFDRNIDVGTVCVELIEPNVTDLCFKVTYTSSK